MSKSLAVGTLAQVLATVASPGNATQIWQTAKTVRRREFWHFLVCRLGRFPSVKEDAVSELIRALNDDVLCLGDLEEIARVDSPAIETWFAANESSKDSDVREVARKLKHRSSKLPRGVSASVAPPAALKELFSTEVDLQDLKGTLGRVVCEYGLGGVLPRSFRFLDFAERDRWFEIHQSARQSARLWLRVEDSDTVEIFVAEMSNSEQAG